MIHHLIDKKTEKFTFGYWPLQDRIKTTLTLVRLGNGNFDIHYNSQFDGLKIGKIENITIPTSGNIVKRVNGDPGIEMEISNSSPTNNHIAIQIKIDAEIPGIGNHTIYNQTLIDNQVSTKKRSVSLINIWKNYQKTEIIEGYMSKVI